MSNPSAEVMSDEHVHQNLLDQIIHWTEPLAWDEQLGGDGLVLVSVLFVGLLEPGGRQVAQDGMQPLLVVNGFQEVTDLHLASARVSYALR